MYENYLKILDWMYKKGEIFKKMYIKYLLYVFENFKY